MRFFCLLLLGALGLAAPPAHAQSIRLSVPDTTVRPGTELLLPVRVDSPLTDRGVTAVSLVLSYDNYSVVPLAVETTGSLLAGYAVSSSVETGTRRIRVAAAGTQPLQGTGVLFYLRVRAEQPGRSARFAHVAEQSSFNEGDPPMTFAPGRITISPLPRIGVSPGSYQALLRGETRSFRASGGADPYTFRSSAPAVASLGAGGLLTANSVGRTFVSARDADGVRSQDSTTVEVFGYRLSFAGATVRPGDTLALDVSTTTLDGLDVTSGALHVGYDRNALEWLGTDRTGTMLAGATVTDGLDGRFAFATSAALAGAGVLVRLRFVARRTASTSLRLEAGEFNEGLYALYSTATIRIEAPPSLSVSPSNSIVVVGRTRQMEANTDDAVTWTSSRPDVATIDAQGLLTGVSLGEVTVTARTASGSEGSATVRVYGASFGLGDAVGRPGDTVRVPVRLTVYGQSVESVEMTIPRPQSDVTLQPIGVRLSSGAAGWLITSRVDEDGRLLVAAAGAPLDGTDLDFADVLFAIAENATDRTRTVSLLSVVANEDTQASLQSAGSIRITTENRPPERTGTLGDATLDQDFTPFDVAQLDTVFSDPDGDALTFGVAFDAGVGVVSAAIEAGVLRLSPIAGAAGNALLTVTATDSDGESATASMSVGVAATSTALTIDVDAGWAMVSMPVEAADMRASSLFAEATSSAFRFEPGTGYRSTDTLSRGAGYWLQFADAASITLSGTTDPAPVTVSEGWNLIGLLHQPVAVSAVATSPAGLLETSFFGYSGSYTVADTLRPGKGYWVKTSGAGTIEAGAASKQGDARPPPALVAADWVTLSFRDAEGRSETLYLRPPASTHATGFDVPPLPPAGLFDVRFSGDTRLSPENGARVMLQGVRYPLTVTASGLGERVLALTGQAQTDQAGTELRDGISVVRNRAAGSLRVETVDAPARFDLTSALPNPFTGRADFTLLLPSRCEVAVHLYDALGRRVTTLARGSYAAGRHTFSVDGAPLSAGLYLIRADLGGTLRTRALVRAR